MTDDEKQAEIVHVLELVTNALVENTPQKQREREEENKALRLGISVLLFPLFSEYITNQRNNNLSLNAMNVKDMDFNGFVQHLFERFDFVRKNIKEYNSPNQTNDVFSEYDKVIEKFIEVANGYKFY